MKKFFCILLFSLPLLAENPKAFSALGDIIYNDAAVIKKLGHIASMKGEHEMINSYLIVCDVAKQDGFAVDRRQSDVDEKNYLALLRILSKEHDELFRKAELAFDKAMQEGNEEDVMKLFASGAVDTAAKTSEIKAYYEKYHEEQELSVLADFIVKQERLEAKRKAEEEAAEKARRAEAKNYQKRKEMENIKHFRERDAAEKRALEKKVTEEMERTKEEAFEKQKRELQVEP